MAGRSFPKAQLVTYKYFLGRLSLLNSQAKPLWHAPPPAPPKSDTARVLQVARAERELAFSFEHCPARAYKNKRLILRYLVPVRMALGIFASPKCARP